MDSRAYFDYAGSSVSTGEVNAAELIQGYVGVDFDDALGSGSSNSVDVGRFTMDLGSRRMVGCNNLRNATNAYTGVRAEFRGADRSEERRVGQECVSTSSSRCSPCNQIKNKTLFIIN